MGRKNEKIPRKKKVEDDAEKEESDQGEEEQQKTEDINKNEKTPKKKSRSASPAEVSDGNEAEDEGSNDEEKSTTSSKTQVEESEESPTDKSSPEEGPSKRNKRKANEEKNKRLPKKKRKELKEDASDSGDDNGSQNGDLPEEYEVAKIVADREIKGQLEYKVRWKGYKAEYDSWEKESHLNCPDLVKKYLSSKKTAKSSSASENGEWEISKIIDMQTSDKGENTFRVRWKGFSANDDTWEPEDNLKDKQIFKDFMKKFNKGKVTKRELRTNKTQSKEKASSPEKKKRRGKGRK